MSEVRMEVVSLEEAWELCSAHGWTFDKVYFGERNNSGKLMMLAYKKDIEADIDFDEIYETYELKSEYTIKYAVATQLDEGGLLFWRGSNKMGKYTRKESEAALFEQEQAHKKAFFMSRQGDKLWFTVKVRVA